MLLAQTTLQIAVTLYRANVTVVLSEDTDLIVLLLRRTPTSGSDMSISYLNEATPVIKEQRSEIFIQRFQEDIGPRLCQADRAFRKCHGGCDTTSLLYGISNNVPLNAIWRAWLLKPLQLYTYWWSWPRRDETIDHLLYSRFRRKYSLAKQPYWQEVYHPQVLLPNTTRSVLIMIRLVLSYVLANTPMESYGQGWGAWSSLVEMC